MNLFVIQPKNKPTLIYFFLIETLINVTFYLLVVLGMLMLHKLRLNFHLKTVMFFIFSQTILFVTSRFIILAYQSGFIYEGEDPKDVPLLIVASWCRGYFLLLILSFPGSATIERELCLCYIGDYDRRRRYWIPGLVISFAVVFSAGGISFFTFNTTNSNYILLIFLFSFSIITSISFVVNCKKTIRLNETLKARKPCRIGYSLGVRYQLEENIWIAIILRNTVAIMTFYNTIAAFAFMGAYFPYFDEETRQIMDCLFNVLLATNAPVFAFGLFFRNSYFVGLLKNIFIKPSVEAVVEDEGDFYFEQLSIQWDEGYSQ